MDPRNPIRSRTISEEMRIATPSHLRAAIAKAAPRRSRWRVVREVALAMLGALLVGAIVGAGVAAGVLWGIEILR